MSPLDQPDFADDDPEAPWVEDTTTELGWDAIRWSYAAGRPVAPLDQIITLAKQHDVRSVLIERRYLDPDWRSMYTKFYGTLFEHHAPTCHRLHFFSETVTKFDDLLRYRDAYKGYTVMRPIPTHPVGRTMILPPPGVKRAAFCSAKEIVRPLGYPLEIEAMPFMSQDGEYMRCSHAVQWMVLYHAHLFRKLGRWLPDEIHTHSQNGLVVGRQVPSGGLSLSQMLNSLQAMGISADKLTLPRDGNGTSGASRLFSFTSTLCRYVNSQMPPIVVSNAGHAGVVVGYENVGERVTHDATTLFIHDDLRGPYVEVTDPLADVKRGWTLAVPPLPQRLYLSADRAEYFGRVSLSRALTNEPHSIAVAGLAALSFRTYAIRSNEFKGDLDARSLPPELCSYYRQANWPGFIWVVEVLDRQKFVRGEPCVIGEAIIDSTATHLDDEPRRTPWPVRPVLAIHVPGKAAIAKSPAFSEPEPFEESGAVQINGHSGAGTDSDGGRWDRRPAHNLDLAEFRDDCYRSGCPTANW